MHQILLSQKAEKYISELNIDDKAKMISGLLKLSRNPVSGKELSGRFDGFRSFLIPPFKIIFELQKSGSPAICIIDVGRVDGCHDF